MPLAEGQVVAANGGWAKAFQIRASTQTFQVTQPRTSRWIKSAAPDAWYLRMSLTL